MYLSNKFLLILATVFTIACPRLFPANAECKPASGSCVPAGLFQNGDRWTVVGDSITQGGTYYVWVYLYYATRFPDRKIELFNAGNSGDSAEGALMRYDWDIKAVATIMFGMNDVKRELYDANQITPELAARRASVLESYRGKMMELAKRLKADGTRIVFVTPSIYDETAVTKRPAQNGVNGALAECSTFMRKLAGETGSSVIDFNGPMTELNANLQATDPTVSLIKPDRVHPNELGHFVMTYLFLKGQQAPALVSSVSIDAKASRVREVQNATVDKLLVGPEEVTFSMTENALPYPVGKELEKALNWVPFQEELNQEKFQVLGLPAATYELLIDETPVRRYSAQELAVGVNLALESNTPQAVQSAGKRNSTNGLPRNLSLIQSVHRKKRVSPSS